MSVEKEQLQLTYYVRSYLNKIKKENINQLKSVFCYFSIWSPCPALSKIRLLEKSFFGSTTWERVCLKLPTLVIATAENQINLAKSLT